MNRFGQARDKGGAYLREQMRPDGGFGVPDLGVFDYYKVPAALQVCGYTDAANSLCNWIRRHGTTPDGDFGPRPGDADEYYYYYYYNIWPIIGAHRLGQFDLSQKGMDFLMGFRDPESGGFYSSPTERSAETLQDLWVVSGCALAAVYTGRTEVARDAGRWMQQMMDAQPDYPNQMYTVYSRAVGLHTVPENGDEFRYVLNNDPSRDQSFYHPGIAGGFLARLYQATGEDQWLALAKEYMRFAEGAEDHLFKLLRAGKVAWAASVLYTLTGEGKYRDMAIRIGDNIISLQHERGDWREDIPGMSGNDLTAEMVVWLDEVHQALGDE